MLRKNQKALQIQDGGKWKYVFCQNNGRIILTANRRKALNAEFHFDYFQNHYGNNVFRAER